MRTPDESGVILIDLHAGWLLRNLPAEPGGDTWALLDQDGRYLVYPNYFDPAAQTVDLSPLLTGITGSYETAGSVFVYDSVYPVASDREHFWVVYRETPKAELYAELHAFYLVSASLMSFSVLLAGLLAYFTSRWLVKPVTELTRMVEAFGKSGTPPALPARLPNDEIGALSRAFCDMSAELERKRRQEHRLIEQLIRAQEEERKLVAYDLHDGLIQQMVGARFYLTTCRDHCKIPVRDAKDGIQRGCDALSEAIVEGRRIIEGLRPAVLDDLGLRAAIEEIARKNAAAAGWQLSLDLQPLPAEPEKTVSVTLYRIAQEALNNVRKHADARHVHIGMHNGHGIQIEIEDDGKGFDPEALAGEGRGLGVTTMHERAALIEGTCVIDSAPDQGTRIHVWVPTAPTLSQISSVEQTDAVLT
jgi:signal transduction histidine kinase